MDKLEDILKECFKDKKKISNIELNKFLKDNSVSEKKIYKVIKTLKTLDVCLERPDYSVLYDEVDAYYKDMCNHAALVPKDIQQKLLKEMEHHYNGYAALLFSNKDILKKILLSADSKKRLRSKFHVFSLDKKDARKKAEKNISKIKKILEKEEIQKNKEKITSLMMELRPVRGYIERFKDYYLQLETNKELFEHHYEKCREKEEKLVKSTIRMVPAIAKKYRLNRDMDMISEGNYGLVKAIKKHDFKRNASFQSFVYSSAMYIMLREIGRKFNEKRSSSADSMLRSIKEFKKDFFDKNNYHANDYDVAEGMDMSIRDVMYMESLNKKNVYLDAPISDEFYLKDTLECEKDTQKDVEKEDFSREFKKILDKELNKKERKFIRMRFGSNGYTLEEIEEKTGWPRENIRQIENISIRKLKRYFSKDGAKFVKDHGLQYMN
ncbi:sigma-70 family RNA polymerase sigma factor [Candidatus Woesearchaeota archaeon]|nr:sigma-70 family RNA polymerase sigma factor [Candidatus Woesearchaeota archaeon]